LHQGNRAASPEGHAEERLQRTGLLDRPSTGGRRRALDATHRQGAATPTTCVGELERKLGIATNTLTNRLEKLVALQIAEKIPYTETRARNDYRLTGKGKDLLPPTAETTSLRAP
jgi:DNA-binding MarR family transcriptional regulator